MNEMRLDPMIRDWLAAGPEKGPAAGLQRTLATARTVAQRPAWTFPRRWLPAAVAEVEVRLPRTAGVGLVILLTLLLLLALAIGFAATSRPRFLSLLGPAADSLVAFDDGSSISVARLDGSGRRSISGSVAQPHSPVFSPDGTRVAFLAASRPGAGGGRLMVVPADGSAPPVDVGNGLEVQAAGANPFAWAPDGQRLAFAAQDQGVWRIFVAAGDGGGAVAITDASLDRDLPSWSPDGNWISYRAVEPDGVRKHLEMIRPDGGELRQVTSVIAADGSLSRLRWSPARDARTYVMGVGFGTATRVVIDLAPGHTNEPWTDGVGGNIGEAGAPWSPDGRFLAFLSADGDVVVADDDIDSPDYDGRLRILGSLADCWLEWSPDGTALYGGSPNGCDDVVVIPLSDPSAATTLDSRMSGIVSWQPPAP